MKFVVIVGDGMADYLLPELDNHTPLEIANTPNMDFIAKHGRCGMAKTIPNNLPAGSDVANLSILGYDPLKYYTGRGALEAASIGIPLYKEDVAFRCNLITEKDGLLVDYSAGHISSEEARILIDTLNHELKNCRLYAGVGYRHVLVMKQGEKAICTPPHDAVGEHINNILPKGEDAEILIDIIKASKPILEKHDVNRKRRNEGKNPANLIWLWGQGKPPSMPSFRKLYGVSGSVISAVDLIKGIGKYAGLDVIEVPGANAYLDTNFSGKAKYALLSLKERDFVLVHVEAPDEAAHIGDIDAKIKAIEDFDEKVVGGVLNEIECYDEYKILVMPDHPTPISVRTHTKEPVPFAIYSSADSRDYVDKFDENSVKHGVFGLVEGHCLMKLLMS